MSAGVHVTPFAGAWYPADPAELRDLLSRLWHASEERTGRSAPSGPAGFVVPHAGLIYSGSVAAAAYRRLGAPPSIVLLGFAHHGAPPGCWLPEVEVYRTPLGDIEVDRGAVERLTASGAFRRMEEDVLCDHSVEIQLPLLLHAAPAARLIPVYVSRLDPEERKEAAHALAALTRDGAVLIASSDLTHFGRSFGYQPFPADGSAPERLRRLDESTIEAAGSLRSSRFLDAVRASGSTVCGTAPISLLLDAMAAIEPATGEIFQDTLDYRTSGDITGDWTHSVSYAALGYYPWPSLELNAEDQRLLLDSVRRTLLRYLETGVRQAVPPERITPGLERRAAAFVTLHKHGELRGCVGRLCGGDPVARIVPELALSAALDDSRFEPLTAGANGSDIRAEISILSPPKRVDSRSAFRVNEHGAILETDCDRGLLLPQVAIERQWTAEQFLNALARKSGTTPEAYEDAATKLSVFRAQVIR
ncbi:MAG TPA: AmmeMemoRadiSam system protein B [Bryobacteraceae bacterium]|nr:AmmeMemoRadiSam system protein B [Bryobacteraceae bacterium]